MVIFILLSFMKLDAQKVHETYSKNANFKKVYSSYQLDELPKFKMGKDSLNSLINYFIIKPFFNRNYEGIISLCLTISKDGDLENIYINGEVENNLFSESVNNMKKHITKWKPGKKNGKYVKSILCLPIIISLR